MKSPNRTLPTLLLLAIGLASRAGEAPPAAPVPPSPYLSVVYKYADTLLSQGRDQSGPAPTGLFLGALDRTTLQPLTQSARVPAGILEARRAPEVKGAAPAGANPHHDQNLLRLLATLTGLSANPKYLHASEQELRWLLEANGASKEPLLLNSTVEWNTRTDTAEPSPWLVEQFRRPWMLWDRCFELAPDPAGRLARMLRLQTPATLPPREAGFFIRSCAIAYAHTQDTAFLESIETALDQVAQSPPQTGQVGNPDPTLLPVPAHRLSLAIDCDGAAHHLPPPLASKLRALAAQEDQQFCDLNRSTGERGGFIRSIGNSNATGNPPTTPLWIPEPRTQTTAQIALMCLARYQNTGNPAYRDLILQCARLYLHTEPPLNEDLWPVTFGHAISLQLAAWRITADPIHLSRARLFADTALKEFWQGTPLPRASLKSDHYGSITGSDTLALSLLELHLDILAITAVRAPSNTIDR